MNLSLRNEICRCRPLLGTFVEITAGDGDSDLLNAAIDQAFAVIGRIQGLMSFHDQESELSTLNRLALRQAVPVSPELFAVLHKAKEIHAGSAGIFDIAVAPELMAGGALPRHVFFDRTDIYGGRTSDIELLSDGKVCFLRPLCIDLGGVAKGFAVDEALTVLRQAGAGRGLVNAGGDISCFGDEAWPVGVRHPQCAGQFLLLPALDNCSLATSANRYEWLDDDRVRHIHGQTRLPLRGCFSVSVRAKSCLLADALTKVVLARATDAGDVLAEFQAVAYIVYPDGRVASLGETYEAQFSF